MPDPVAPESRGLALITGGSAGIGAEAARALADRGWEVVLAGRDRGRLAGVAEELRGMHPGRRFSFRSFDVGKAREVAEAIESIEVEIGPIDLLVTSAGIGVMDFLDRLDPQTGVVRQIDANLTGTILVVQAVLPMMIRRRGGTIILVGSLAGLVATPTYSIYAATKFGLMGFADALRREVGVWGIRVCLFLPGAVSSGFAEESVVRRRTRFRTPRGWVLSPRETGEAIARLAERPRRVIVLPRRMAPLLTLARIWPGLVDWVTERFFVRRERAYDLRDTGSRGNGEPGQRL